MRAVGSILFYLVLLLFSAVFFVVYCVLFLITIPFDRKRWCIHRMSGVWAWFFYHVNPLWKVRVEGMENVEKGKAYVTVVNHQSMLDIPMMYAMPFLFRWVSKREVYKIPVFGLALRMQGGIAIERGASASTRKMMAEAAGYLGMGLSIMICPEGTRSHDGQVHRFKEGAFMMAKQSGVPILPCLILGTGDVQDGWKMRMPHRFTLRVLPPVSAEYVARTDVKELTAEVHSLMSAEFERLKKG